MLPHTLDTIELPSQRSKEIKNPDLVRDPVDKKC